MWSTSTKTLSPNLLIAKYPHKILNLRTLEKLFFAVDDYVADPELRKKVGGLNDEELRAYADELYGN